MEEILESTLSDLSPGASNEGADSLITPFIGSFDKNLDGKSRFALPQTHKDKLKNSTLILMKWFNHSLAIFPEINWWRLAHQLNCKGNYSKKGRAARNLFYAHSRDCSMDKEGRVVIPPDMVKFGRIDKKLYVIGDWDKILISNPTYYLDEVERADALIDDYLPDVMDVISGQKTIGDFEKGTET